MRGVSVVLALVMLLPAPAMASHMSQYLWYPNSHDVVGTVAEPDFAATSVLGPRLANCVIDVPLGGIFSGGCGDDALRTSLGTTIAPGCTGTGRNGEPERRLPGQCGLWNIGSSPQGNVVLPPGTIPAPVSEPGMGSGHFPGRYAGTVRFLDGSLDSETTQNPGTGGPTNMVALNRYLRDLGVGPWVLPGDNLLWAWYGDWTDLNGNGVVDACYQTCNDAMQNEFVWLGNCAAFGPSGNAAYAVSHGYCQEDPNPNAPGSRACDVASGENGPCAKARIDVWVFPGNHNPGTLTDTPGEQVVDWTFRVGDCSTPPTCDEDSTGCEDLCSGDPLLDNQAYVTPDGLSMDDRTGDNGAANLGDDTARQWAGNLGNVGTYYGDDGLLETLVVVYGVNCAVGTPNGLDLGKPAGADGGCTFLDVDKTAALNPTVEQLLIGDPEHPTGGLKGALRGVWDTSVPCPADLCEPADGELLRTVDAIVNSRTVYEATLGPQQGLADDLLVNPGWSREPNSPPRSYRDAAGALHAVEESYPGTAYGDCEAISVGDPRNPTPDPDTASLAAQQRGFCNLGAGGLGTAYNAFGSRARGWLDLQPLRHLFHGTPVII